MSKVHKFKLADLKDDENLILKIKKVATITITKEGDAILIRPQGTGLIDNHKGAPILVDRAPLPYAQEWCLSVWSNINKCEPTYTISLKESQTCMADVSDLAKAIAATTKG